DRDTARKRPYGGRLVVVIPCTPCDAGRGDGRAHMRDQTVLAVVGHRDFRMHNVDGIVVDVRGAESATAAHEAGRTPLRPGGRRAGTVRGRGPRGRGEVRS